jgi:hypothetical protein
MSTQHKHTTLLVTAAESIGSTLGTIAAKASALPNAISRSSLVQTAENEGKKFVRKSKNVARKIEKTASQNVTSSKFAKASRRTLHRATTATKRMGRPVAVKKKAARQLRRKK